MSKMSDLMIEIQELVLAGEDFESIAKQLSVPVEWVYDAETALVEDGDYYG
jgi:hypothetical protein